MISQLARDLMTTRLQKLARIATKDAEREKRVESHAIEVEESIRPGIAFRNFTSRAAATDWLTEK